MRECVRSMCGVSVVALQFLCLLPSLFGVSWGLSVAGGSLLGMGFVFFWLESVWWWGEFVFQ